MRLWVPAFDTVPWKDIIALHDHDAIGIFREKLIEAEEAVAELPEAERDSVLKELQVDAMAKKIEELVPTRTRVAVEVGQGLLLDLLSTAVPYLGTMVAGVKGLANLQREDADWTAVLLRLRGGTRQSI